MSYLLKILYVILEAPNSFCIFPTVCSQKLIKYTFCCSDKSKINKTR